MPLPAGAAVAAPPDHANHANNFRYLLGAMYLQLGDLVHEHALMRQCEGCNRLFFPGRTDQRFCSSHCGDAARQRERYAERKTKAVSGSSGKKARATRKPKDKRTR